MEYTQRKYPEFAACGLNCGLCPRFHTDGTSRCPGCAGEGFSLKHPSCGILSCCRRHGVECCCQCGEYPCRKYERDNSYDSFISYKNQSADLGKAKDIGLEAYTAELGAKVELLKSLLNNYDDGRRKSFYCNAVNLLELQDLEIVMEQIKEEIKPDAAIKEKAEAAARLLQAMAEKRDVSLQLRKKANS